MQLGQFVCQLLHNTQFSQSDFDKIDKTNLSFKWL